jgi:uroporphyrinogen III methyltransferase/synthase
MGTVYLIGAGPGDPGLLTLRGARILRRAAVVVHDALVDARILAMAPPQAERIDVGKRYGRSFPQSAIHHLLIEAARRARTVVRLKGGDPFVFGRGGEEVAALVAAGVRFEIVPGVSAALGAAAYAGIPLTHRDHASAVTFVTGQENPARDQDRIDWQALAKTRGTLAIYMGVHHLRDIAAQLIAGGAAPDTPAAVVESATQPNQRTVTATLGDIAEAAQQADIDTPALVLVGAVVRLQRNWFEERRRTRKVRREAAVSGD